MDASTVSRRVVVLGASGFVGRHVVQRLRAGGAEVVAVSRRGGADAAPEVAGVPLDLTTAEAAAIADALRGAAAVVNLVGIKAESGRQTFEAVHVGAVARLLAAMRAAGVRRLVHVSVVVSRPDPRNPYHDTKWRAERLVQESGLDATVLRPGVIYGEGDDMLSHLARMIRASPVFPVVGRGASRLQPVHVEDVARAVAAVLAAPASIGRTYDLVGPEAIPLRAIVERVARALALAVKVVATPVPLMRAAVRVMGWLTPAPLATPAQVRMLEEGMTGDPAPLARDLGIATRPFTEATIRPILERDPGRPPLHLRLAERWPAQCPRPAAFLFALAGLGILVMTAAFPLRGTDRLTTLTAAIGSLGLAALPVALRERPERPCRVRGPILLGLLAGLAMAAIAGLLLRLDIVAAAAHPVFAWRAGHAPGSVVALIALAVLGEELFWRGALMRLVAARRPASQAILLGALAFAAAHLAAETWLLPAAGFAVSLAFGWLYLVTRSLAAPVVAHLAFDLALLAA